MPSKMCEITYPFPNIDGCIVEILEWIMDIPYIIMDVIT